MAFTPPMIEKVSEKRPYSTFQPKLKTKTKQRKNNCFPKGMKALKSFSFQIHLFFII